MRPARIAAWGRAWEREGTGRGAAGWAATHRWAARTRTRSRATPAEDSPRWRSWAGSGGLPPPPRRVAPTAHHPGGAASRRPALPWSHAARAKKTDGYSRRRPHRRSSTSRSHCCRLLARDLTDERVEAFAKQLLLLLIVITLSSLSCSHCSGAAFALFEPHPKIC